jgi:hypothetical protein
MRRNLRATLGVLSLLVTTVAGGLAPGAVVAPSAGATVTPVYMGTTNNGVVAPVNGTTHTDFPDPAVVSSGTANTYYAYSTGTASALGTVPASWTGGGIGVTMIGCTTGGCTDQTDRTVAMPITNASASITRFWGLEAPSVVYLGGQWVMYYGGVYTAGNRIYGVYDSTSTGPTSGFTPPSATPLMYQAGTGGSSDPSAFIRPTGQPWLLWKSATWKKAPPAKLWSMQLTTDGTAMKPNASPYTLAKQPAGGWTGTTTVENPQMVWSGGTYYLFYSGGHWTRTTYGEGYMACSGPTGGLGPTRTCGTPNTHEILSSATNAEGPGGGSLFTTKTGAWLMAFHGWNGTCTVEPTTSYYKCGYARQLYVRPVDGLYSTSLPSISTFKASSYTVGSGGGTVTLYATATRATTYKFTANRDLPKMPTTIHTTGSASVLVHLPVSRTKTTVTFTFTVTVTGPYGGQVSRQLNVVEAADGPFNAPVVLTVTHELGPVIEWTSVGGAASYEILRNGIGIASTTATSYRDVTAAPETDYTYQIQAKGSGGSVLATSGSVNLKYNPIVTDSFHGSAEGIYRYNNTLQTVYISKNNVLYHDLWNPTTSEWTNQKLPNSQPALSPPAVTTYGDDSMQVVYVGPTDVLYHDFWNPNTNNWTNQAVPNATKASGSPAVTTYIDGSLQIVYVNTNHVLYHDFWTPSTDTWTNQAIPHATPVQGSPAVTTYSDNSLQIIYINTSGVLYHDFWNPTTATWTNQAVPNATAAQGSPAVTTYTDGSLQIVYINAAHVLSHDFWTPSTETWTNQAVPNATAAQGSPAVTTYNSNNSLQIVYINTTHVLSHDFWNPTADSWTNEKVPDSVSAQGSPAVTNYINGSLQILYDSSTNKLHHDFWNPTQSTWTDEVVPHSTTVS